MIVIPYRAKNPPDHFPYATLTIIVVNALVYSATTDDLLRVTPEALDALAFSHNHYTLWRMISAMFLHANPFHILGNMLFFWIFGASVEGRLGPWKFLAIYFGAGIAGFVFEDAVVYFRSPDTPCLGASGAIMGIAGAYLYIFPYSTICIVWGICLPFARAMWHARWLILYFVGVDLVEQINWAGADGVAHLAHLSGFAVGLGGAAVCRPKRDSLRTSDAQAVRSDVRDTRNMTLEDLEALITPGMEDAGIVLEYCRKLAIGRPIMWEGRFLDIVRNYGPLMFRHGNAGELAYLLLYLPVHVVNEVPGHFLLQLGARLDVESQFETAIRIYSLLAENSPAIRDAEAALTRLGHMMDHRLNDAPHAHWYYSELIRRFPNGHSAYEAKHNLERMYRAGRVARP